MPTSNDHVTQPQGDAPCGPRVVELGGRNRRQQRAWLLLALVACVSAGAFLMWSSVPTGGGSAAAAVSTQHATAATATAETSPESNQALTRAPAMSAAITPVQAAPATVAERADFELPSLDPNDLASQFRPGDPEPTMAEVIRGLQEAGIREGIGAFNPPGTVPLLPGIAVPEDFELPPGYVRHYQVTDEGEMLEAVLMFSPDHQWLDRNGNPIPLPDDGLVPPEMAPPGMPIEPIHLPEPPRG